MQHRNLCPKKYNGMSIRESASISFSEVNEPEENVLISSNEMVLNANSFNRYKKSQNLKMSTDATFARLSIKTSSTTLSFKLNKGKYMHVNAYIVPVISGNIVRRRFDVSTLGHLEHLVT